MADSNPAKGEAQLADDYLATAIKARQVADHALDQALKDAKASTLRDPSKTAQSAIIASGVALDKRLILQERPTQILAIDPSQALNALGRKLGLTIETTASDAIPQSYGKPRTLTASETPELEVAQTTQISSSSGESEPKTRARVTKRPKP